MKKMIFIPLILIIISCTSELQKDLTENIPANELVEVGFRIGGEISVSEKEIKNTKNKSADLFALQVIDLINEKPYAHVVGDSISKIKIQFPRGNEYRIQMTYLKDARHIVRKISANVWGDPFVADYLETELNKVYYSSATRLRGISSSFVDTENPDSHLRMGKYVEIDRYYGVFEAFKPTEDSSNLNINLKRMAFGIKLNVELEEIELDSIKLSINSFLHQQEYTFPVISGKGVLEIPYLSLGFPNFYSNELEHGIVDNYEENVPISIGTRENATKFYDGTIPVPRNTMMIITFTHSGGTETADTSFNLLLEEGEMEEEEFTLPSSN